MRIAALLVLTIGWNIPALAQTAAQKTEGSSFLFLYGDHKALKEGDIVTILVTQRTTASDQRTRENGAKLTLDSKKGTGLLSMVPDFGFESERGKSSDARDRRSLSVVASMTALVTKVLPNGNLEIQGLQNMVVGKRKATLKVTGIIRPQDVNSSNTVLSHRIANAQIELVGGESKGGKRKKKSRGLIGGIVKVIRALFGG